MISYTYIDKNCIVLCCKIHHRQNTSSAMQISHAYNDYVNTFNCSMIIVMSTMIFDDGAKSAWTAVHWSACARLCDVFMHHAPLHFSKKDWIQTTDKSQYNRPNVLNGIDVWTLCWPQNDIIHLIDKTFLVYPYCIRCCPIMNKGTSIYQRMVIDVWLKLLPEDFMSIILCS